MSHWLIKSCSPSFYSQGGTESVRGKTTQKRTFFVYWVGFKKEGTTVEKYSGTALQHWECTSVPPLFSLNAKRENKKRMTEDKLWHRKKGCHRAGEAGTNVASLRSGIGF